MTQWHRVQKSPQFNYQNEVFSIQIERYKSEVAFHKLCKENIPIISILCRCGKHNWKCMWLLSFNAELSSTSSTNERQLMWTLTRPVSECTTKRKAMLPITYPWKPNSRNDKNNKMIHRTKPLVVQEINSWNPTNDHTASNKYIHIFLRKAKITSAWQRTTASEINHAI